MSDPGPKGPLGYVRRIVYLLKTAKVNTYMSFYLYMQQPKTISKCLTLMTSKRLRNTYISDTGNMVEI